MSTAQYALNGALLLFILGTNLGTRRLSLRRLVLPVVLVVVAGSFFLRDVPTVGHDMQLEAVGVVAGAVLGVIAGLLLRVQRHPDGTVTTSAGTAYAALWVAVIGGRVVFAYGADHWFGRAVGEFSRAQQITGAGAWTAAFVLMALTMVAARVAVTAGAVSRTGRSRRAAVAA
jgi:hypothetical protein